MMTFLAQVDFGELSGLLLPIIVVCMSMSIPIVAIITEHLQKKERMRLMAIAIEHGTNIDNLNLEGPEKRPQLPYRNGMVCLAVGIALILANRFVDFDFAGFQFPLVIGGLITSCVGLALLLNDWMNRDHFKQSAENLRNRNQ